MASILPHPPSSLRNFRRHADAVRPYPANPWSYAKLNEHTLDISALFLKWRRSCHCGRRRQRYKSSSERAGNVPRCDRRNKKKDLSIRYSSQFPTNKFQRQIPQFAIDRPYDQATLQVSTLMDEIDSIVQLPYATAGHMTSRQDATVTSSPSLIVGQRETNRIFHLPGFSNDLVDGGNSAQDSSAGKSSSGLSDRSSLTKRPLSGKPSQHEADDFDNDDYGNGSGNKRPRNNKPAGTMGKSRKLACPFYKYNPEKYSTSRTCVGPGWESVFRVKEHLYRRHTLPRHKCTRCLRRFDSVEALSQHSRSDVPCQINDHTEEEGLNDAQEKELRKRPKYKSHISKEVQWRDMYMTLFPNIDPSSVPSPYYDDQPSDSILVPNGYLRQELPRLVCQGFEAAEVTLPPSLRETLRLELSNIVSQAFEQAFRNYRGDSHAQSTTDMTSTSVEEPSVLHLGSEAMEFGDTWSLDSSFNNHQLSPNLDAVPSHYEAFPSAFSCENAQLSNVLFPGFYDFEVHDHVPDSAGIALPSNGPEQERKRRNKLSHQQEEQ